MLPRALAVTAISRFWLAIQCMHDYTAWPHGPFQSKVTLQPRSLVSAFHLHAILHATRLT